MLTGKTVILGVTGSIAAYKMANVASMLVKLHCDVHVIMTQNATHFIHPITFETITKNKCLIDTFDRNFEFHVAHVSLGQQADAMLIAPASANIIGKVACGIADDMLSTVAISATCPKLIAPAMNTHMLKNPIVQDNLEKLRRFGFTVIPSATGVLACRDEGEGRLPEETVLVEYLLQTVACEKDLAGKNVLVTAGPTREAIDPVRYVTNHSSGKMGYAIARIARLRGATVTLITGPTALTPPLMVRTISVDSAAEMAAAVKAEASVQDIVVKAAAVADYRPATVATQKMKKKDSALTLKMEKTEDILSWLGAHRVEGQVLCGFSMETENLIENSRAKRIKKQVDLIVANNLYDTGAGFCTDTNRVTLMTKDGEEALPLLTKEAVAGKILDVALHLWQEKHSR